MESDLNFEKLTLTSSEKSEYLNEKNKEETKPKIWENPYRGMKIDNHTEILCKVNNRSKCVSCNKSRKFFCYTCYIPVDDLKGKLPKVKVSFFQFLNNFFLHLFSSSFQLKSI